MRNFIVFILLLSGLAVLAQEGGVLPDSVNEADIDTIRQVTGEAATDLQDEPLMEQDSGQEVLPEQEPFMEQEPLMDQDPQQEEAPYQEQDLYMDQDPQQEEIPFQEEVPFQEQDLYMDQDPQQDLDPALAEERPMVEYSPDFEFRDGLFANFESVLENNPIPAARIVTDEDLFDREFFEKITNQKEITIYDDNGVKKVLLTENIWGYSRNGILHINVGGAFHRISFMGSISHFVATVTTYQPNHYDPYYYNPYYSSSYYYNRYSMPQSNIGSTDLRQYLLDFQSGDVMEYDTESVEVLLMKDPELADEYQSLSNRKKKQMKFVFIRRFNERHPLYFPAD